MKKCHEKIINGRKTSHSFALTLFLLMLSGLFNLVVVHGYSSAAKFVRIDYQPSSQNEEAGAGRFYLSFSDDVSARLVKEAEIPLFYLDILGASLESNPFLMNFPHGPAKMVRLHQISDNPKVIRATFFLRRRLSPSLKNLKNGLELSLKESLNSSAATRDSYTLIPPGRKKPQNPAPATTENETLKIQVKRADPAVVIRELARGTGKIVHFRDPMLRQVELDLVAKDSLDAIAKISDRLNLAMTIEDGDIWISSRSNPLLKISESHRVEGVDLSGLALGDVLRALGQISELNIVLDDSMNMVQANQVQMYLKNMSVRRAMETLLKLNKLELREVDDKTLLVITQAAARGMEGKVVRIFSPQIPVETLKTLLEKSISDDFNKRIAIHEDLGNMILVGDKEAVDSVLTQMISIQEKVKKAGEGVFREYFRPINTKNEDLIKMVKEVLDEKENIKISFDKRTDMILLVGAEESVKRALEIVKKLDQPRTPQALIHIRLIEIHRSDLEEIGIKLPTTLASTQDIGRVSKENYVIPAELVGYLEKTKVKTLANPTVRCMDKEEATIDISEQIPVKNTTTDYLPVASSTLAARTSDNWTTSEVGIKMNVTPIIHPNDEITMDVDIDQTELVRLVEGHPWTAKRQIKTKVRMKNRETVVIGGLIRSKKDQNRKPVPFLSRIPLIRRLVRRVEHQSDNEEKTELVVLISPALVSHEEKHHSNRIMMPGAKKGSLYAKD